MAREAVREAHTGGMTHWGPEERALFGEPATCTFDSF